MKDPALDEKALRITQDGQKLTIESSLFTPDNKTIEITDPHGLVTHLTLTPSPDQTLSGTFHAEKIGIYEIKAENAETSDFISVGDMNTAEFRNIFSTETLTQPLSKISGGKTLRTEDQETPKIITLKNSQKYNGSGWIALRDNDNFRITDSTTAPVLPLWLTGLIVLLMLVGCWRLESKN
jgi:hypothetical protein